MTDRPKWHFGNTAIDGDERGGWFIGPSLESADVRRSSDVEITWATHSAGEGREAWFGEEEQTTLVMLISGRFRIDLSVGSAILAEQGDYAIWGPGIGDAWRAEQDSVIVTVRWPAVT
jgi:hypothetical protein